MGSGGLTVDDMAIGCLGVDRRVDRFFILSHFWSNCFRDTLNHSEFRHSNRDSESHVAGVNNLRVVTNSKNLFIGQYDTFFEEYW